MACFRARSLAGNPGSLLSSILYPPGSFAARPFEQVAEKAVDLSFRGAEGDESHESLEVRGARFFATLRMTGFKGFSGTSQRRRSLRLNSRRLPHLGRQAKHLGDPVI